jgi:hypothetical protein
MDTMTQIDPAHAESLQRLRERANGRKLVLNVGCGKPRKDKIDARFRDESQWCEIRLDLDPEARPDILADLTDLSVLPEGSVQALHSAHNLEHLYAHQVVPALQGFLRVLEWGGELVIHTPDLQTIAAFIAQGSLETPLYTAPAGAITPLDMAYGLSAAIERGSVLMAHRTGFTNATLAAKVEQAGFSNIHIVRDRFDLALTAYKLPAHHPKRGRPTRVTTSERFNPREAIAVTVENLAKLPHPGALWRGKRADELDVAKTEVK